jgi:hypothetical protein
MDRIRQSEIIIVIVMHKFMKKGIDERPNVTRNFVVSVVPKGNLLLSSFIESHAGKPKYGII